MPSMPITKHTYAPNKTFPRTKPSTQTLNYFVIQCFFIRGGIFNCACFVCFLVNNFLITCQCMKKCQTLNITHTDTYNLFHFFCQLYNEPKAINCLFFHHNGVQHNFSKKPSKSFNLPYLTKLNLNG